LKILIVDDSRTMRKIVGNVLLVLGVKKEDFDEAENGARALSLVLEKNYDFILTDWNMPVMDGLTFVKKVRALNKPDKSKTPILMITTEGGREQVIDALRAGVNNYIVKPFSAETLKDKMTGMGIS